MKPYLLLTACLLSMNAMGQTFDRFQIFQPKVYTGTASVLIPEPIMFTFTVGETSWSMGYLYDNKAVLEISGKDSVLTVIDAKLAGKRIMEDRDRELNELQNHYKTIEAANELINHLLKSDYMPKSDVPKLDRLLDKYNKLLNPKP